MVMGQIPPHDIAAEEAMVGSILIDGQCMDDVIDMVQAGDFYHEVHGFIYGSMLSLHNRHEAINQITVAQELQQINKLDDCGGVSYLSHLISIVPSPLDIVDYANIVRRTAFYRKLIGILDKTRADAMNADPDMDGMMDKFELLLQELQQKKGMVSRRLTFGIPRLIETNPPRYIWEVNGKDMRLTLPEITLWGKFKNRVISDLNFVPIRPKDWDETVNNLITKSIMIEAPADASEEQQLKILIQKWFERMREASIYSELAIGRHIIREVSGIQYYCFKSTPLLDHLKKEWKRGANSEDLWAYAHNWNGIRHKFSVKSNAKDGRTPCDLWCLPMNFAESYDDRATEKQPELIKQEPVVKPEPTSEFEMPEEF